MAEEEEDGLRPVMGFTGGLGLEGLGGTGGGAGEDGGEEEEVVGGGCGMEAKPLAKRKPAALP